MTEPNSQAIRDQAATWFVQAQSPDFSDEDWRALHAWLAADSAHADAYAEVEAVWVDLDEAEPASIVTPLAPRRARRGPAPIWLGIGAALAASLAIAVMIGVRSGPQPTAPVPPTGRVYASLPGEQKPVVLQDGTQVMLNGDTRLEVSFATAARRVVMLKGEAIFDVTHDPTRPFVIALGDRQVRVVGTQFNILRLPTKLAVTVKRGVVAVEPTAGVGESRRLVAGTQLVHRPGEAGSIVSTVDPNQALGWRSGRLSYNASPLADVGGDLGRYLGKPVQVDADIAGMPFTGVLNMDEEGLVLRRLETFLPVRAEASATGIRLSRAKGR